MKKAQEFLVDTALGEKKYELPGAPGAQVAPEEKIVLSIEEGAVPVALLKEAAQKAKDKGMKNFFARLDEAVKSLGKPTPKDRATFFRLMAIMINAGIPLIKSLDTIAEQTVNHRLKSAIFEITRAIEKGGTLSDSMARYPHLFSESQLGAIKSGEAAGQLNKVLKQLAIEVEKAASITRKVKGAMMYPSFIIVVMIAVVAAMMILVVPKIAEIFTQTGQKLPALTIIVIGASRFMQHQWPWIFGGIAGIIFAFIGVRRTTQGRYATDWLVLHIPLFGGLVKKSILARFSRSLGNLLSSGVPIIQGLLINAKGLGNEIYKRRVTLASEDISRGIPLGESLRDTPEFPAMMVQMIAVGEQTAQLDNIAAKIAEYYEDEVDTEVAGLSKVIEPVILVAVGVVVGGIIGAIMLPIIQLTQTAGAI
ncbi:type II secretion system F family protein [Candidatus Peregrinibacteria bacterium]|nr:type II secretion system F family protein [Candidatus Peregrinibacteria bacterium]